MGATLQMPVTLQKLLACHEREVIPKFSIALGIIGIIQTSQYALTAMTQQKDAPLVGHLVIYVDGYKMYHKNLWHGISQDGKHYLVPDKAMPAEDLERGSQEWWHSGWAIGDNARGRLCLRFGSKPLLSFKDYDAAVAHIESRQRKHKQQRHTLVYVSKTVGGREIYDIVHFLDDILAIDAERQREIDAQKAYETEQRARLAERYPELDKLRETFGYSKARSLADLLRCIRSGTPDDTLVPLSKSTRYRMLRELREVGLI
ncbi:hypothetical protein AB6Q56_09580 [Dechloromonas sp. ARDL1]|uniref:hypothetical protein n=1 Tax=Dechloromonas sp. ARDL1 TaxID=3322121 RepID=UPI003DA7936F